MELALAGERYPKVPRPAHLHPEKLGRRNAHDSERMGVHGNPFPNHRRALAKAPFPAAVADNGDGLGTSRVIRRSEGTPQNGLDAQGRKEFPGHQLTPRQPRLAVRRQVDAHWAGKGEDSREDLRQLAKPLEGGIRE